MKYLQSDNSKNTYGLYEGEIGPGHLVAIIEFETVADGDKLIRPIAAADALLAVCEAALYYIGAIPINKIDYRDAEEILDQLGAAIDAAKGSAAGSDN